MEISERERLMLAEKKEEILELTKQTMDLTHDSAQVLEVKKRITSILSKISTIASYAKPRDRKKMEILELEAQAIFKEMDLLGNMWTEARPDIEEFCNMVNSIQFEFEKRGVKIRFPDIHVHPK